MRYSHLLILALLICSIFYFNKSRVQEQKKSEFQHLFDSITKQNLRLINEIDSIESQSDSLLLKIDSLQGVKVKIRYVYDKEFKRLDSSSANTVLLEYYKLFAKHNIK